VNIQCERLKFLQLLILVAPDLRAEVMIYLLRLLNTFTAVPHPRAFFLVQG
jgi:hypothetical protein